MSRTHQRPILVFHTSCFISLCAVCKFLKSEAIMKNSAETILRSQSGLWDYIIYSCCTELTACSYIMPQACVSGFNANVCPEWFLRKAALGHRNITTSHLEVMILTIWSLFTFKDTFLRCWCPDEDRGMWGWGEETEVLDLSLRNKNVPFMSFFL